MTWEEFKDTVEKAGVKNNMEINYIDIPQWESFGLHVEISSDGTEFRIY